MMKRNWSEISEQLAAVIPTPKPVEEPLEKRTCYNFNATDVVTRTTNQFVHENFYKKSNVATTKPFFLRNHLTNKDIRVSREHNLTVEHLENTFGKCGHCLAYKMAGSYVSILMMDFDCYNCKNKTCTSVMEKEIIEILHNEILNFVKDTLKNPNVQCVIFKNSNSCNLHFYFNVSVSIIVLELIRKRLIDQVSECITKKYLIDDIYILDLPFSTKTSESLYKPVFWTKGFNYKKLSCLPTESQFYDVPLKLNVDEVFESYITLGKFYNVHSSNWNDDVEHIKYLLTPLEFQPVIVKVENPLIVTMKIGKLNNFQSDYELINKYFVNEDSEARNAIVIDASDNQLNEIECKVLNQLKKLGVMLGKKVILRASLESECDNLLNFLLMCNGDYSFYIIMCFIMYIHYFMNNFMTLEECKQAVVKILKLIIISNGQVQDDVIIQTLNLIEKYDCMENVKSAFEKFDDWFKFFINIIKLNQFDEKLSVFEKKIRIITTQLKIYDSMESIYSDLVNLCSMLLPVVKVEHGLSKIYYYDDVGIYVTLIMEKFFSSSNVKVQSIQRILKNTIEILRNNNQISNEIAEKINIKDIWLRYFEGLILTDPMFNFYDYFISTEYGVFNTITGLYMAHTPLLYMNTQKRYCVTPHVIEELSIFELNKHIMKEKQSMLYSNVLKIIMKNQNIIFYGSVMIPGLLTMKDTLFNRSQENDMLLLTYTRIVEDDDHIAEKLLYFVEPLVVKYELNIGKILDCAEVIEKNVIAYGAFTRSDVSTYYKSNNLTFEKYDFKQKADETLYDQLSDEQVHRFNSKFFALSVIMLVFEKSSYTSTLLAEFTTVEPSILTISKYHMFYDISKYSLSIKSHDCIKRVIEYLTAVDVPGPMLNLIQTLSTMLNRDHININDFMNIFAMLYHHTSKRKKLALLIGNPNSGKSTYQHILFDMHRKSSFSMTSIVQAESQGPSPEVVNALSNYLFSIIELKQINSSTMKSMISGDMIHKRMLHQNEMLLLRPLCFAIAACNSLPKINQADEAIRDRLAPFLFKVKFVDENDFENYIDDNALLAEVTNIMVSTTKFQIPGIAREFANLIYEYFQQNRDSYGLMQPKISIENKNSQDLIHSILMKNNAIYYILDNSGIVFNNTLSITYETLEDAVSEQIDMYKTRTNRPYNWSIFKNELSLLFKHKELPDKSGFVGMGLKSALKDDEDLSFIRKLFVYKSGEMIPIKEIRSFLFNEKHLKFEKLKNILLKIKQVYADYYDSVSNCIKDHILNHETS